MRCWIGGECCATDRYFLLPQLRKEQVSGLRKLRGEIVKHLDQLIAQVR